MTSVPPSHDTHDGLMSDMLREGLEGSFALPEKNKTGTPHILSLWYHRLAKCSQKSSYVSSVRMSLSQFRPLHQDLVDKGRGQPGDEIFCDFFLFKQFWFGHLAVNESEVTLHTDSTYTIVQGEIVERIRAKTIRGKHVPGPWHSSS